MIFGKYFFCFDNDTLNISYFLDTLNRFGFILCTDSDMSLICFGRSYPKYPLMSIVSEYERCKGLRYYPDKT